MRVVKFRADDLCQQIYYTGKSYRGTEVRTEGVSEECKERWKSLVNVTVDEWKKLELWGRKSGNQ